MKLRALTLGSAAIAGTLFLAVPAFAQQSYYDTNPTPEERTQTDQLNGDAANRAHDDADSNDAANNDYNAARSDYDRNRQNYDAQRAAYDHDRARYDDDARSGDAHRWDAFYGHDRFRDVARMDEDDLVGLTVDTRGGSHVGRIRNVDTEHGDVARVSVSLGDHQVAWLDADDLRFDPGNRTVMTDLSRDQIEGMAHTRSPHF
jgi:hypothetical protein